MSGADSVFPFHGLEWGRTPDGDLGQRLVTRPGITKRELFAAMAMQGLVSNDTSASYDKGPCNAAIVARAITLADALIAELAKEQP